MSPHHPGKDTMHTASLAAAMLALAMVLPPAAARAAEFTVLAGGSMTASLKELGPRFEGATGHKLVSETHHVGWRNDGVRGACPWACPRQDPRAQPTA